MTGGSPLVLGSLDPGAANPFGPGSMIRRVVGEPVMTLLYPRALAMQVAHASVAAAVAEHSQFQQRPVYRLWATSDAALRLVFGSGPEPMGAARQIYRFHDGIHGAGEAGPYTAHDASLLLWVWATLVDTCDVGFTRWVRPYRSGEGERFYQDMCGFARFFGIPASLIPSDRAAFVAYLDRMMAGEHRRQHPAGARDPLVPEMVLAPRRGSAPPRPVDRDPGFARGGPAGTDARSLRDAVVRIARRATAPELCPATAPADPPPVRVPDAPAAGGALRSGASP